MLAGYMRLNNLSFLFSFFEKEPPYVIQTDLELAIFLPKSSESWDYKCIPPCPASNTVFLPSPPPLSLAFFQCNFSLSYSLFRAQ
jgi:hypothetical protein